MRQMALLRELSLVLDFELTVFSSRDHRANSLALRAAERLEQAVKLTWIDCRVPPVARDGGISFDASDLPMVLSHPDLMEADLVIGDNVSWVLHSRPDAVLVGSFLWREVEEWQHSVGDFRVSPQSWYEDEVDLLLACRPPMICNYQLATPGVLALTQAIPVSWMVSSPALFLSNDIRSPPTKPRIYVTSGTSGSGTYEALYIIQKAVCLGDVIVDKTLADCGLLVGLPISVGSLGDVGMPPIDIVICRATVGIVTECVGSAQPFAVFADSNYEMRHNAHSLVRNEICNRIQLDGGTTIEEDLQMAIEGIAGQKEKLKSLPVNGLGEAALWISSRGEVLNSPV